MHSLRKTLYLCLITVVATCPIGEVVAQDDLSSEPYVVYVSQEGAHARCGPSGDYYRTDRLRHGQTLEVYAETDDGWLGIRPPKNSFCWVVADTIEAARGSKDGTVIEDRTVAWIGTHLGRARKYRWQVQLAKGEPVSILGRSEREGPDGPQQWFRIAPPSGEFRWVHRDQVVRTSEALVASVDRGDESDEREFLPAGPTREPRRESPRETTVATSVMEPPGALIPEMPASSRRNSPEVSGPSVLERDLSVIGSGLKESYQSSDQTPKVEPSNEEPPKTLREAVAKGGLMASIEFLGGPRLAEIGAAPAAPGPAITAVDSNWVGTSRPQNVAVPAPQPTEGGFIRQVSAQQSIPGVTGTLTPTAPPNLMPLTAVSPERVAAVEAQTRGADVDRLSLLLSRLMAAKATSVEAEPVAQAAFRLASVAPDQVTQGRARLLAERVQQYQRVSRMREAGAVAQVAATSTFVPGAPTIPSASVLTTPVQQSPAQALPPQSSTVAQVGHLVQVYSARSNTPPYALTDNAGRTLVYVTPSPGVNIRLHLNSYVKVIGQQGFLRGLNTPHILVTQAFRAPQ